LDPIWSSNSYKSALCDGRVSILPYPISGSSMEIGGAIELTRASKRSWKPMEISCGGANGLRRTNMI
jgi:hypothetical protein